MEQLSKSVEQQQKQLMKLEDTLAKQSKCTYCLITTTASDNPFADAFTATNRQYTDGSHRVSQSDIH